MDFSQLVKTKYSLAFVVVSFLISGTRIIAKPVRVNVTGLKLEYRCEVLKTNFKTGDDALESITSFLQPAGDDCWNYIGVFPTKFQDSSAPWADKQKDCRNCAVICFKRPANPRYRECDQK